MRHCDAPSPQTCFFVGNRFLFLESMVYKQGGTQNQSRNRFWIPYFGFWNRNPKETVQYIWRVQSLLSSPRQGWVLNHHFLELSFWLPAVVHNWLTPQPIIKKPKSLQFIGFCSGWKRIHINLFQKHVFLLQKHVFLDLFCFENTFLACRINFYLEKNINILEVKPISQPYNQSWELELITELRTGSGSLI